MIILFFRKWEIRGAPIGSTCSSTTAEVEKCLQPTLPVCKDMNKYCSTPPAVIFSLISISFHLPVEISTILRFNIEK